MTTLRDLNLPAVWVDPKHLAATAGHVLRGHGLKACGVVDAGLFVGLITLSSVDRVSNGTQVGAIAITDVPVVEASESVRALADRFAREGLDHAAALDDGVFCGVVTPTVLLKELGKSFDPLTELCWSDELRAWGVQHLTAGEEVTIIFIDLNDFGAYNKQHGHVIGDQVLMGVAKSLRSAIDPARDVLVRYGGDEFAIATSRTRDDAELLAAAIQAGARSIPLGDGIQSISFTVGLCGGRRQKERLSVHFAATIDNMINRASQECLAKKSAAKGVGAPVPAAALKKLSYRVIGVFADGLDIGGVTTVILSRGSDVFSGASTDRGVSGVLRAAAEAISSADPGMKISLESIRLQAGTLEVTGFVSEQPNERKLDIKETLSGDENVAAVTALVAALG